MRGCTPATGSHTGCSKDDSNFKDALKAVKFLLDVKAFDTDVCYCSKNLCLAGCNGMNVNIGGYW